MSATRMIACGDERRPQPIAADESATAAAHARGAQRIARGFNACLSAPIPKETGGS
jgi:hypothetical protein